MDPIIYIVIGLIVATCTSFISVPIQDTKDNAVFWLGFSSVLAGLFWPLLAIAFTILLPGLVFGYGVQAIKIRMTKVKKHD